MLATGLDAEEEPKSYIEQMDSIIKTVEQEESKLILKPDIVHSYKKCSNDAKLIFIRLQQRKLGWIRVLSLDADKYPNAKEAINELSEVGLVSSNLDELIGLLKKNELLSLAQETYKMVNLSKMTKSALLQAIMKENCRATSQLKLTSSVESVKSSSVLETVQALVGPLVQQDFESRLQFQKLIVISQRLEVWPDSDTQLFTDSILSNLSADDARRRNFVKYNVYRNGLIWDSVADFEAYFDALKLEHECAVISEANDQDCWLALVEKHQQMHQKWVDLIREAPEDGHYSGIRWFSTFTHTLVFTRMLSSLFYPAYFRLKRHKESIDLLQALLDQRIFLCTKRGYWYDELARLTENYVSKTQAKLVIKQGLSDTLVVTHHRSSLYKRLAAIAKVDGKIPIQLRDCPSVPKLKKRQLKGIQTQSKRIM